MLPGRESLVRLVGKSRRTRSSHLSQILDPQKEGADEGTKPSSSVEKEEEAAKTSADSGAGVTIEHGDENYDSDWVSCPVCGTTIRGNDYIVNSHLDICLSRGTKWKLTQRTLLQLSFCPRSRSETHLGELDNSKEDARGSELFDKKEHGNSQVAILCSSGNCKQNQGASTSSNCFLSNLNTCMEAPTGDIVIEDEVTRKVVDSVSSLTFSQSTKPLKPNTCGAEDAKSAATLETFIVGRRFHDSVELQQGARISVLRDPLNAKDRHAIKVLFADSGCGEMLGYLPRELAKYLSPLMDDHHVKCEGSVISLPKHPLDPVPVQLVCQKMIVDGETKSDDQQILEFLWKSVMSVTEYVKTYPPSMTKYQRNFCLMVEDVLTNHSHLFTHDEKLFLGSFDSLSNDSQRLFVRLYTRKGPWFRISSISYSEISDPQKAIEELQSAGYICLFNSCGDPFKYDIKEVLEVLNVSEMREVSNLQFFKNGINCTRRQELIDKLSSAYENGACPLLPRMVLERAGTCVKISSAADMLLWRIQRLFFLNGEQDLSAFLLVDLGLIKFPEYSCIVSQPIFRNRSDLLEYEEAIEVAQIMDESLDENNVEMVIRCIDISDRRLPTYFWQENQSSISDSRRTFFSCFSAAWVYSKVLSLGVSVYERERRYNDAVRILKGLLSRITCDSRRGYWTLRLSVDLEHMGHVNESLLVAEEGVIDPWVRAGSKMALQRRVIRLGKPPRRWKTPSYAVSVKRKIKEVNIGGRPLICETGTKNLFYGYDDELCGVEQLALQYYAQEGGWQGVHSESGIWMTIFGVLMWDVIFSNVPNVFRSRFQTAPLDLYSDDFYVVRKNLIESQLQKIQEGMAEEILITSWESHFGTACRGINWERHSLSELRAVVFCIGGQCLASLCRHLALDYRSWSSGMPDLLLWRFHGRDKDEGEAKLVEVKGPKDRLSEQQRAWMLILMDCGFNTEVCKVNPTPISR